jgi:hypothetical protein
MKLIFVLVLMLSLCYAADPVSDAALFVDGFLRGALTQDIGRVDGCLKDGDSIIADVGKLITDIESGFDLIDLVADIGTLLTDIPASITDCADLEPTVKDTFNAWIAKINNPISIGKIVVIALTKYRTELTTDATSFVSDWGNGDFEKAGLELGDIPHTLFDLCAPTPLRITPADVGHFLDGFLSAALQSEITEVGTCLKDADALIDDLTQFVVDIEAGFDLLPLIGDLGKLLTDIPHSIEDCTDFATEVDEVIVVWEAELKNPVTIAKIVYIALSQYEDRIKGDANSFVADWKADIFEKSGSDLGDIPHVLFDLCPAGSFGIIESFIKDF